jgi:DNA-binding NtrC family response regulator
VNDGSFREDLFYRLAVAEIFLPPLRQRGGDVAQLAEHFWHQFAPSETPMPTELIGAVRARSWPGNVRELRNFVERVAKLGWGAAYGGQPLRSVGNSGVAVELPLREARRRYNERFDEIYANALLTRAGGSVTRAAELAGVNRRSFQRMLAKAGGDPEDADLAMPEDEPGSL